jgi:hypothetical protein
MNLKKLKVVFMKLLFTNSCFKLKNHFNLISFFFIIISFIIIDQKKTFAQASISGAVWHDQNGNGEQDGGEPYMTGFTVELRTDGSGTLVTSMPTGAGGTYSFTSIPVGTYYIRFIINAPNIITPSGFGSPATDCDITGANPATGTGSTNDITIAGAENITDIDGGYYIYATIGDKVWHDQDADGEQDAAEPGINGIAVTLSGFTGTGVPFNQPFVTAGGGLYQFTNVPPGTYTINFDDGATYEITYQDETTDNLDSDPDPATGDVMNISVDSDDDLTDID